METIYSVVEALRERSFMTVYRSIWRLSSTAPPLPSVLERQLMHASAANSKFSRVCNVTFMVPFFFPTTYLSCFCGKTLSLRYWNIAREQRVFSQASRVRSLCEKLMEDTDKSSSECTPSAELYVKKM